MQGQGAQLGSHTIQTHGVRLARKHTHDLVVLVLLAALVIALHYAPPFNRFVGKDMMAGIRYPVKPSTVPAWTVPIISILCPWVIFISIYVARRDVYDLHHATLGVLFAVLVTAIFTDVIKTAVGRPRPDFFWQCFPDGKQLYDQVTGDVICHGKKSFSTDGRKSFPSGHTSWSFAGLGFLSLYLSGKMKAFDRQGHVAKLCIVILPLLLASLVGISRVDDYRHHWGDVFVGGLIGFIMALLCYLHFFPPPYHYQGFSIFLSRQIPFSVGDRMHTSTCWRNFERPIQTMHKTNTLQLQVGNTLAYPGRSMTGSQVTIWNLEVGNLPASCA